MTTEPAVESFDKTDLLKAIERDVESGIGVQGDTGDAEAETPPPPKVHKTVEPRKKRGFLDSFSSPFRLDIGIDLGTANTLVYVRGEGIVVTEPSVVAVTRGSHKVIQDGRAIGADAKRMLGKVSHSVDVIRPLRDGVISNFALTEAMLRYFINKVSAGGRMRQARVVIAIPFGITNAEMNAAYASAMRAGASKVRLIEETLAAGLGAGLNVEEPTANLIVDIGGGTTGISVLSVTDIAYGTTVRAAGDHMTEAIIEYMRQTHGLHIGVQTAEQLKIDLGNAAPGGEVQTTQVRGQSRDGKPGLVEVSSDEIREAMSGVLGKILRGIEWVLENTPPELSADLVDRGILVTGGGALIPRIDELIADRTGLVVQIAEDPLTCVARGTGVYLETVDWRR